MIFNKENIVIIFYRVLETLHLKQVIKIIKKKKLQI